MGYITIKLDVNLHKELKKNADINLRSMKNELLFILKQKLNTRSKPIYDDDLEQIREEPKTIAGMEIPTLFMDNNK